MPWSTYQGCKKSGTQTGYDLMRASDDGAVVLVIMCGLLILWGVAGPFIRERSARQLALTVGTAATLMMAGGLFIASAVGIFERREMLGGAVLGIGALLVLALDGVIRFSRDHHEQKADAIMAAATFSPAAADFRVPQRE